MKIKFLFIPLMLSAFLLSCESESLDYQENSVLEKDLKSKNSEEISLKRNDGEYFSLQISTGIPLQIESNFFEVKSMTVFENGVITKEGAEILVFKPEYRKPLSTGGGPRIYDGWYWDTSNPNYDRFIYGTFIEDTSTGQMHFFPASIETQFLMNWQSPWGTKYA